MERQVRRMESKGERKEKRRYKELLLEGETGGRSERRRGKGER